MIKYVIAKNDDKIFENYILKHLCSVENENYLIVTNEMGNSIFEKYNYGIKYFKSVGLKNEDVICFVHEDIRVHDLYFEKKVNMVFENRPDIGILGVIGTTNFVSEGGWWFSKRPEETRGQILQDRPDLDKPFHMIEYKGFFDDLVSVDGCCFFMSGKMANTYQFDEETYDGYHFYDVDVSFGALEMGYKVAVADILVEHASEGQLPISWFNNKKRFFEKWTRKGLTFPVNINSIKELNK